MSCDDLGPWFIMYVGGTLNSFGFSGFGKSEEPNVERVNKNIMKVGNI